MKHIMISIRPEWVCKILNREKLLEIRKSFPKEVLNGEECIVEIYCTKNGQILAVDEFCDVIPICPKYHLLSKEHKYYTPKLNGFVVARWHLKKVDEFKVFENGSVQNWNCYDLEKSCLTYDELSNYIGKNKVGYGWHIDNLEIYDKPKELSEFYKKDTLNYDDFVFALYNGTQTYSEYLKYQCALKRPPQSWCYVEGEEV